MNILFFTQNYCIVKGTFKIYKACISGTDHFTCRGVYGFLFHSEFFFRTTQELTYFFCRAKREFFFHNLQEIIFTVVLNGLIQNQSLTFSKLKLNKKRKSKRLMLVENKMHKHDNK
jgi:hypothetical protein